MKFKKNILLLLLCFFWSIGMAQKIAVKTNVFWDALLSVSLGTEYGFSDHWSVDMSANFNGWTLSHDRCWKHWFIQPEARYWFSGKFSKHFVGAHLQGGLFNLGNLSNNIKFLGTDYSKLSDERFQGWFLGLGFGYGYSWLLSRHWSFEAEVGVGYAYSVYDRYPCATCGEKIESGKVHHYLGPTKIAFNLIYQF